MKKRIISLVCAFMVLANSAWPVWGSAAEAGFTEGVEPAEGFAGEAGALEDPAAPAPETPQPEPAPGGEDAGAGVQALLPPEITLAQNTITLQAGAGADVGVSVANAGVAPVEVTVGGDAAAVNVTPAPLTLDGAGAGTLHIEAAAVTEAKTATISLKATNDDGEDTKTLTVSVTPKPVTPAITLSPDHLEIENETGASENVLVTVVDVNQTPVPIKTVTATSSDEAVIASPGALTLDGAGQCTLTLAPQPGQTGSVTMTIEAENDDGDINTATLAVEVTAPPMGPAVAVDKNSITLQDTETDTVEVTVTDSNVPALGIQSVEVASDKPAVLAPDTPLAENGGVYTLDIAPQTVLAEETVTLTLTATNTRGKTGTATVTVKVYPTTNAPRLDLPDTVFEVQEDTPFTLAPLDPVDGYLVNESGIAFTMALDTGVTTQNNGTVKLESDVLTYTPAANHFTPDGQEASDTIGLVLAFTRLGQPQTTRASLRVKVNPEEDAPLLDNAAVAGTSTDVIEVTLASLLAKGTSVDLGELEFAGFGTPVYAPDKYHGTWEVKGEDEAQYLEFLPHIRFEGTVTFPFTVKNKGGTKSATAGLTITVAKGANAQPQFVDFPQEALSATEDTPKQFSFIVKDRDIPSPAEDKLSLTVTSGNPAILQNTATAIDIAAAPVQGDEDAVEYTVTLNFEQDANTTDTARYGAGGLTLTVQVEDEQHNQNSVTLPVTVAPENDAPVLVVDSSLLESSIYHFTMAEDDTQSFTVEVRDVDMPEDASGYTLEALSDTAAVLPNLPANVAVGAPTRTNRDTLTYTITLKPLPNANTQQKEFSLQDVALALQANDGDEDSNSETVMVTVTQVPDAPVAVKDTYNTDKDVAKDCYVLKNDSDLDGKSTLSIKSVDAQSAEGGALSIEDDPSGNPEGDGKQYIRYTPAKHFSGKDTFSYVLTDGLTDVTGQVEVTVKYKDYPPVFIGLNDENTAYTTNEDSELTIPFEVYDDVIDASTLVVVESVSANAALVEDYEVRKLSGGRRELWVKPAPDKNSFNKADPASPKLVEFQLRLGDGTYTITRRIKLNIQPVNDAPKAVAVTVEFNEGVEKRFEASVILSKCSDVDKDEGDTMYLEAFGTPSSGTLKAYGADDAEITGAGDIRYFIYTPEAYFDGTATVTYTIKDSAGMQAHHTLSLKAIPKNDPPTFDAPPASIEMDEDGEWVVPLTFSDPEMEHPILILESGNEEVLNNEGMTYVYNATGATLTLRPRKDRYSASPFNVKITVSDGAVPITHTISLKVNHVPDPPSTPEQSFTTMESTPLRFDPLLLCLDVDADDVLQDEMTVKAVTPVKSIDEDGAEGSEVGSVVWSTEANRWVFTPEVGFVGEVWYEYTVEDKFHGQFTYPATFTKDGQPRYSNYPAIKGGDTYNGQSTGLLKIQVGTSAVGPSVRRLPPIIAFAGQEMDEKTLETKNIRAGEAYSLKVEVIGGPVDPDSVKLDDGTATLSVPAASGNNPTHSLKFQLKPGVVGDSVVRVTVSGTVDGTPVTNSMSFAVRTHATNQPPVITTSPVETSCNEGVWTVIDVIDLAGISDPEGQKLSFSRLQAASTGDSLRVKEQGGGYVLEYRAEANRNAHTSPNATSFTYTVADQGGEESTGIVNVKVISQNHAPYTWDYYVVQDKEVNQQITLPKEYVAGSNADWGRRAHDYDGDVRYLHDTWAEIPSTVDSIAAVGDNIVFTPNTAGWITIRFRVKSSFDGGTTWDYSSAAGGSVHVYVHPTGGGGGDIPPMATGSWKAYDEDEVPTGTTHHEMDITSWLFGKGSPANPDLEFVNVETVNNGETAGSGQRLTNVGFDKRQNNGKNQYILYFDLVPDANSYTDANGDMTDTLLYPQIQFTVKNQGDTASPPAMAKNAFTVRINPKNDLPVIEEAGFTVENTTSGPVAGAVDGSGVLGGTLELDRNEKGTIRFQVTDPDYPTKAKCDSQIRVNMTSSNGLVVRAEQAVIALQNDGYWTAEFEGFVPGDTLLTLTAYDEEGGASLRTTQVKVTVSGANRPPVAQDYYAMFNEDTKASVTVFDDTSDEDMDPVEIEIHGAHASLPGTVSTEGDKLIFNPDNDFCHDTGLALTPGVATTTKPSPWNDSEVVEIEYRLKDAVGAYSDVHKVFLHFNPLNDAPTFVQTPVEQFITEGQEGTIFFKITDVDSTFDPEHDLDKFGCTFTDTTRIESATVTGITGPVDGVYTVTVKIVPKPYQCHKQADTPSALTLTATDSDGAVATQEIGLVISPVNDAPQFKEAMYGDPLRVTLSGDELETLEDNSITIDLTKYFIDPDGDDEPLYIIGLTEGRHGKAENVSNKVLFTPTDNYCTTDKADYTLWGAFGYKVADAASAEISGTVEIYIIPDNDPPVLKAQSYTCDEDSEILIENLFAGSYNKDAVVWDIDNPRDELRITKVGRGSVAGGVTATGVTDKGGAVTIEASGGKDWHIRYTPRDDFSGTDTFYYTVADKDTATTQKITVVVTAQDDPPRANFELSNTWMENVLSGVEQADINPWELDEDDTATYKFMAWDPDGGKVLFTITPQNLTESNCTSLSQLLPNGAVTNGVGAGQLRTVNIAPLPDKYGKFDLLFELEDNDDTASFIVPVHVKPVNDAPGLADAGFSVDEDAVLNASVEGSDKETPKTALKYSHVQPGDGPAHGDVTVAENGSFTYTPDENYFGPDVFYIQVKDGGATNAGTDADGPLTDVAKISITVNHLNDAPSPPTGVTVAGGHYKGGDPIQISWKGGRDLDTETRRDDLTYWAEWSTNGTTWTEFSLGTPAHGGDFVYTATVPGSVTAGKNTDGLQLRVYTKDDGLSYLNNAPLAPQAAKSSAPSDAVTVKVDSTAPGLEAVLVPAGWTNAQHAEIRLTASAGSAAGASAIDRIEMRQADNVSYATISSGAAATVMIAENGDYHFRTYDKVGNFKDLKVTEDKMDRVQPVATASPSSISGKTVVTAPKVTLSFVDPADTSPGKDTISGILSTGYQLVKGGGQPAADGWIPYNTGDEIAFPARGSYTLYARAADNADNVSVIPFTSYVIDNAAPETENATAVVYEHDIATNATRNNTFTKQLQAQDADGDTLSYHLVADAEKTKLEGYGTLSLDADTGVVSFTHDGSRVTATETITLSYYVDDGTSGGTNLSNTSTLTVTMHPVNDVPADPADVEIDTPLAFYRKDKPVRLTWAAAADEETAAGALEYEIEMNLTDSDDTGWQTAGSVTGVTHADLTAPDGNTAHYRYRVRAKDTNPSTIYNLDDTTGPAMSGWVVSPKYILDNTKPTVAPEIAPNSTDPSDAYVIVKLNPEDKTPDESWQSGVKEVRFPGGVTKVTGEDYTYKMLGSGSYTFYIEDKAGNILERVIDPAMPKDPVISYTPVYTRHGRDVAVSWTHEDSAGCRYELDVTYDDGATWQPVLTPAANHTTKSYTYRVPDNFTDAPDTVKMRFRVRAWKENLHSANFDEDADIVCDTTKPVISLTASTNQLTAGSVTMSLGISDPHAGLKTLKVEVGSDATITSEGNTTSYSDTFVVLANALVKVTATDACGNVQVAEYTVDNIDTSAPAVSLSAVTKGSAMANDGHTNAPITFTMGFVEHGVSGMKDARYAITQTGTPPPVSGWTATTETSVVQVKSAINTYYVHLYAEDNVGNYVQEMHGPFYIDNTLPRAKPQTVSVDEGGSVVITLRGEEDDPGDEIKAYTIVGAGPAGGSLVPLSADPGENRFRYTHDGVDPISNTAFEFYVTDDRGEDSLRATVTINVREVNDPPELENLSPDLTMNWNSMAEEECDLFDPDHLFAQQQISISSSNPSIIPVSHVVVCRTVDSGEPRGGKLKIRIRPLANQITTGTPVRLTFTAKDPKGATDTATIDVTVERRPLPPKAKDQYYFVVKEGKVASAVQARLDEMGTGLEYDFGTPSDTTLGTFLPGAGNTALADFSFEASTLFVDGSVVEVPVTVRQQDTDGGTLTTDIRLIFQSEAVTTEKRESDEVVTLVPSLTCAGTPSGQEVATVVIQSDNPSLLKPEKCRVTADDYGNLYLHYTHEPYKYGVVNVKVKNDNGEITIPIVVYPENDPPEAKNTFTAGVAREGLTTQSLGSAEGTSTSLYVDTVLSGGFAAGDALDHQPSGCSRYGQSYASPGFAYTPVQDPQHGTLAMQANGRYTYTPEAGYTGPDSFTIRVEETAGYQDNQNPPAAQLGADVVDVTTDDTEPLLARLVRIDLKVIPVPENAPEPPGDTAPKDPGTGTEALMEEMELDHGHAKDLTGGAGNKPKSPKDKDDKDNKDSKGSKDKDRDAAETGGEAGADDKQPPAAPAAGDGAAPAATAPAAPQATGTLPPLEETGGQNAAGAPQTAGSGEDAALSPHDAGGLAGAGAAQDGSLTVGGAGAPGVPTTTWAGIPPEERGFLLSSLLAALAFFFLLVGSVIRVRYHVVENGEERVITRYRVQRIHYGRKKPLEFALPKEDFPEGTVDINIHFGWFYRRRFYEQELVLAHGDVDALVTVPEKKHYREKEKGLHVAPDAFAQTT